MSTENENPDDSNDISLDDFAADFFGQKDAVPDTTKPEDLPEEEIEVDANTEEPQDDDVPEDDTSEDDEETEDESEEEEEPVEAPKPKKNRFQERIDELTNARREAEREAKAALERIAALEAKLNGEQKPTTPAQKQETDGPSAPTPNALNEDGTEKYPLGEFDPNFISDLADFRVEQRFAEREREQERKAQEKVQQERAAELETQWNSRLESARERYPDFNDKAEGLGEVFVNLDDAYGEYLGNTLMSMDKGADVLYYLANNPDVAREIVNSGAQRATIALGRLEAQFAEEAQPTPSRTKVTKAPVPPPQTRGSSTARGRVSPDTDDLDAFGELFFQKK